MASVIVIFSVVVCDNPEVVSYKLKFHLRNLKAILPLTLGRYLAHRMFVIKIIGCKNMSQHQNVTISKIERKRN